MTARFWFEYDRGRHVIIAVVIGVAIAVGGLLVAVSPAYVALPLVGVVVFWMMDLWIRPKLLAGSLRRQSSRKDPDVVEAGAAVMAALSLPWEPGVHGRNQVIARAKAISKREDEYYVFLIKSFIRMPEMGVPKDGN